MSLIENSTCYRTVFLTRQIIESQYLQSHFSFFYFKNEMYEMLKKTGKCILNVS